MRVGQLGRLLKFFRAQEIHHAIMAGQIAPRNLFDLRPDLKALLILAKLKQEISVLESYLPKQLSAAELEKIISDMKAANPQANMGVIMKALKESYGGQYDSKAASEIAKRIAG